ncbi:RDD family protein [Stenoxybacter acetivorans]|uniref:RDD family protein n=1 Tax=Stenoxybacter acetivorans TaxID=422441 RepID=UPI00055C6BA9|nr:RDD family protein [Stenoxybacter acetivorans]
MAVSIGTQELEQKLEVELASPVARIGAFILNVIINSVLLFSISTLNFLMIAHAMTGTVAAISAALYVSYFFLLFLWLSCGVCQLVWMTKYGQSIGKRIFGIKVVKLNGENPGFLSNVLLRECVFYLIIFGFIFCIAMLNANAATASLHIYSIPWFFGIAILSFLVGTNPAAANLLVIYGLNNIPWLICLIMLYRTNTQRRTLQDYLAGTLVVKARKGQ